VLESPRLRLRRLRSSDEQDLIALDSDPDVMRYVGSPAGPRSADEIAKRLQLWIAEDRGPLGFWVVEGRLDGGFRGLCALIPMPSGGDVELAYRLGRASWGRGLATEAARTLVEYAFEVVGLQQVVAVTYPDNRASQRVLEKVGFTPRGFVDYKGVQVAHYVIMRARGSDPGDPASRPG